MSEYSNAVAVQDLVRKFGDFTAVNGINFTIPKGEIFGLLGPNGAGKTTTIHMLTGLLSPTEGTAQILGYDVRTHPEDIKRQIGYMSQRFSLYNDLTAYENLQFYASVYAVPRERRAQEIDRLIDMAGLRNHRNELTVNLSGAWRQRLALACAIVHRPPMLFLDEPTAGVDPVSRREFWDLIYEMAGSGVSILATTHYMDEAEYCNTIGMMYQGNLIALAEPDVLRQGMPGHLIQVDCERPGEAEVLLAARPEVLNASVHGAYLHVILKDLRHAALIESQLSEAGLGLHRAEPIPPSLDDVFISLVADYRSQQEQESA